VELIIWLIFFAVSVAALLIGAAWFSAGAARFLGKGQGDRPPAIAIGAALPELALALAAALSGRPELVLPIIVGSSIANILLVAGVCAAAAKDLPIAKECARDDASFLALAAVLLLFSAADGVIVFWEGLMMIAAFFICVIYLFFYDRPRRFTPRDIIAPAMFGGSSRIAENVGARFSRGFGRKAKNIPAALLLGLFGALLLAIAADLAIESLAGMASLLPIGAAALSFSVLAAATALPEIQGSLRVIAQKRYELALGNVFLAVAATVLPAAGICAMISPLPVGRETAAIGLPFFAASAVLLTVSGFSRKINFGQGWLYLLLYSLFLAKLFNLF